MKKNLAEEMRLLHNKWQESGHSKIAFCKSEGISNSVFHYWHKQFTKVERSGFSEISLKNNFADSCELIFPTGVRMVIGGDVPLERLRVLLF
jgi:hypothetical protein